jgi:hypothetical protein
VRALRKTAFQQASPIPEEGNPKKSVPSNFLWSFVLVYDLSQLSESFESFEVSSCMTSQTRDYPKPL